MASGLLKEPSEDHKSIRLWRSGVTPFRLLSVLAAAPLLAFSVAAPSAGAQSHGQPAGSSPTPMATPSWLAVGPSGATYYPSVTATPSPTPVKTQALTPIMFQGIDIAPVVELAKRDIVTVTKPFKVYHWSPFGGSPHWRGATTGHDPQILANAKMLGNLFWKTAGTSIGSYNRYGNGLYAAADPVETYGYAKASANWELVELTVPVGFQYLNLANRIRGWDDASITSIVSKFSCGNAYSWSRTVTPDDFFTNGGVALDQTCFQFVKKIYKEILNVGGLAYSYGSHPFVTCETGMRDDNNGVALLFFRGDWMNASNVEYFTSRNRDNTLERRYIQTLFLGTAVAHEAVAHAAQPLVLKLLSANPTYSISPTFSRARCNTSSCQMSVTACAPNGYTCASEDLLLPVPSSATISTAESLLSEPEMLLWSDLEGQPKTTPAETDQWLRTNRLGCDGSKFTSPTYPNAVKP